MHPAIPDGFTVLPTYAADRVIPGALPCGVLSPGGIQAWRHTASGVRVVLFAAPGPLVSATIVVGTQPVSNAGHPHTLEHIIFLGSHRYPQRGYLDNLACRCLADGTNAWTDNEYTAYTTRTAGFDGFVHLLPCFLDHVLRPRINAASFASEVYHVRADGKEAGVVFCEMQARENTEGDVSDRALRAALLGGTPLALDSGGLCADIRTLTNQDIARFHGTQYCGGNVTVIVGGSDVKPASLLGSVKPLLDEVAAEPGYSCGQPQWTVPLKLQPLPPVSNKCVHFPCPDQDIGTLILGWRGPGTSERLTGIAIDVLLRYLCGDVWSPLRQKFVEVEDQVASEVSHSIDSYLQVSVVSLSFSGVQHLEGEQDENSNVDADGGSVDAEELDGIETDGDEEESFLKSGTLEKEVMQYLANIVKSGELPGGMRAMQAAIKKETESQLTELESGSHDAVPYHLIEEVVYGQRDFMMIGEETRGFLEHYAELEGKDERFWISILDRYLVSAPRVELVMVPDASLAEEHAEEDSKAHARRVESIGKDVLERIGNENEARIASLESHKFAADVFPPMPSTMNISRLWYSVSRETAADYPSQSVTLETNFVHCTMFFDTSTLTIAQRALLPVLCELIPTCDILMEDGTYTQYTDHASAISEATVSSDKSGVFLGYGNEMAHQCVVVHFAAMPHSFQEAANTILQTLFQSEVTMERLSAVSQTLHSTVTGDMRDGELVLGAAVPLIPFLEADRNWDGELPNYLMSNFLGSQPLLTFLSEEFTRKKPRKTLQRTIIRKMHESLNALRRLNGSDVFVQIAAKDPKPAHDILASLWMEKRGKLADVPTGTFEGHGRGTWKGQASGELPLSRRISGSLRELLNGRRIGRILGIAGVESSCVDIRVDSPVYLGHADWSALSVLTEMLSRMDGPLCNAVRGAGLAYGVHLSNSSWTGHLVLSIYESSDPAAAWDAICRCLTDFRASLNNPADASPLAVELETAKASTLYSLNRGRSTPEAIATGALSRTALGAPASPLADRALEEDVEGVSLGGVGEVFDRYVRGLWEERERLVVATCGAGAVAEVVEGFRRCEKAVLLEECAVEGLHPREVQTLIKSFQKG